MKKKFSLSILIYFILVIITVVWIFPIFWTVINSFKSHQDIISKELVIFFQATTEHYERIFRIGEFGRYLINSIIVSVGATIIAVFAGTFAAYSLSRFDTGGKNYSLWVLSTRMLPPAILIIPFYIMFRGIDLINTWYALIIAYTTFNLSFVVWIMKGFFDEIPKDIEEAGLIDGASRIEAIRLITFPLAKSGIITTTIFCVLFSWNEFLFALVLTISKTAKTLPVAANDFVTAHDILWGPLCAAGTIIIIPVFIFVFIVQKNIVRGLTLGALE